MIKCSKKMKLWRPRNRIIGNTSTLFYLKTVIRHLPSAAAAAAAEFQFAIKNMLQKTQSLVQYIELKQVDS
jgi:hypothetical protein